MNTATAKVIREIIGAHKKMVARLEAKDAKVIVGAADAITRGIRRGGRVYICGNGGSAADAQHIAGELVGRFERRRRPLPATALTTDTSIITSIANDDCYEAVFARQVGALVGKGDILWAISTSGASKSIVAAAKLAKKKGARVLAFTGRKESPLERVADICLCADSSSTARSQEIHQLAYHIICKIIDDNFAGR